MDLEDLFSPLRTESAWETFGRSCPPTGLAAAEILAPKNLMLLEGLERSFLLSGDWLESEMQTLSFLVTDLSNEQSLSVSFQAS